MSHQDTYLHNEAYTEFLHDQDEAFFAKYADTLQAAPTGRRLLDVGCGVGQVLRRWKNSGSDAWGVEVSLPSVSRAQEAGLNCRHYDGTRLPFPDAHFDGAGALNVLEHVEQPEEFISELARVVKPSGRLVISSPNFFRAIGFRDYHHTMRGLPNKWRNLTRLLSKRHQMRTTPDKVRFDRMTPVVKDPFEPDDDAIVATNALEIAFFVRRAGCRVDRVQCTDRYVPGFLDFLLNCSPSRFVMFNAFVVATKNG